MFNGRVYILSIDALPFYMLKEHLFDFELRNFQRLFKEGAYAEGMISSYPDATTPPAHAGLFCGCPSVEHKIYSFEEPVIEDGVVHFWKKRLGFDARRLEAEPLWASFLKSGKSVAMLHFPLSVPVEVFARGDYSERLIVIDSFSQQMGNEFLRRDSEGGGSFEITLWDKSKLKVSSKAPLKSEDVIIPEKRAGFVRMRLASDVSGERDYYFGSSVYGVMSNYDALAQAYIKEVGPFVGSGAIYSYWQGRLGAQINKGGNGGAERRLIESLKFVGDHFYRAIEFVLKRIRADVGFYYFHGIDLLLHLWMGLLDEDSRGSRREFREFLLPLLRMAFEYADRIVGLFLSVAGEEDLLVVVSDHGMVPIDWTFYPNQVLLDAGYMRWDEKKKEPLSESIAVYHPSNSGYILINTEERGGPVRGESVREICGRICELFSGYIGSALEKVEMVSDNKGIPGLGEIYLTPAYKVALSHKVEGRVMDEGPYGGQHHYWNDKRMMKAVMFFKGPGVPCGVSLGERNYLEFAPTVSALCGIDKPVRSRMRGIKF